MKCTGWFSEGLYEEVSHGNVRESSRMPGTLFPARKVEFLLQARIMLNYHPVDQVYQMLWELFYDKPDALEEAALNIFSAWKLTWPLSGTGHADSKGLQCDIVFPYLPIATPSTLSLVTQLHTYFENWMQHKSLNKFVGKFILLDIRFAQFGLIFKVAISGFRDQRCHLFRENITPQIRSDLTGNAPTDPGSSNLVASTMVEFRHNIVGAGEHPLPALLGFKRTMLAWEENCLDGIGNDIDEFLDQSSDSPLIDNLAQRLEVDSIRFRSDSIKLVFGPSGTGKTKHLESLLSRNWGFHFVAGKFGRLGNEEIHMISTGAHRNGHSLDLHWLWSLVTSYPDMAYGEYPRPETLHHWTLLLLHSRFLVLWVIQKESSTEGQRPPSTLVSVPEIGGSIQRAPFGSFLFVRPKRRRPRT